MKQRFGRWNCSENFEIMDDRWCILTLFETRVWKLELLRKIRKQGGKMVHSDVILNDILEVEAADKKIKEIP